MQMAGHAPLPHFMVVQLQLQLQLTVGANMKLVSGAIYLLRSKTA